MGFFDKKYCDVCGNKIGLLGNRKLEDGNLCKDCAAKLSPWFEGRRHSMLADIKAQLADREANAGKVASFRATKKFGKNSQRLFIDEANGNFAVCYESDWKGKNPDIIPLTAIRSCKTDTDERRSEKKYKDKDGKMCSYNPPQYDYSYDFYCTIEVDHPYIDDIRFRLNDFTLNRESGPAFMEFHKKMREYEALCDEIPRELMNRDQPGSEDVEAKAKAILEEAALLKAAAAAAAAAAPQNTDWDCPGCGASNHGGQFCEYCGTKRP